MNPQYDAPPQWGGIGSPEPSFRMTQLSTIPVKPITWIDFPFLQGSAFHLLAGVKNSGKGTWLAQVAARVTRGEFNPDGWPQKVLWLALGEDSYAIDVRPRIEVAGGDPAGVMALEGHGFKLPDHGSWLEEQVRESQAALVIVDPLGGAFGGKSTNDDTDVRAALQTLNQTADLTGTMVFGVRHISNKVTRRGGDILANILGSSDWVNIPRAVLAMVHDDVDPQMRHLFAITGNRGPSDTPGLMFRLEGMPVEGHEHDVSFARVLGESHKDPDELLVAKRAKRTSRSDTARVILASILGEIPGGSMESDTLDAEVARRTGLAARTIRDIRMEMRKQGYVRAQPEKDSAGDVVRWFTVLTNAGVGLAEQANAVSSHTPPTSSLENNARARGNANGHDSGLFPANDHIPTPVGYDSGGLQGLPGVSPANDQNRGINGADPGAHNLQLGFGLNTPESPESSRVVPSDISYDSGVVKPFSMSAHPDVSTEEMPEWERQYWQRQNGGSG